MAKQLLIENAPFTLRLEEAKDAAGNPRYLVRGQFARSDRATENKRLYREHLWKREIGRLAEGMKSRRAFGELDHPADGRTKLQRVSHLMTDLRVEGDEVVGEAEILDTPNGRILQALFKAGAQVGVSSRGYGSTKSLPDGIEEVQEDFRLDTFDFVADPATKTAYPKVFQEEIEHVRSAEAELTVESLKRDYSGLLRVIAEESMGDVSRALVEAEERAATRLKGTFQSQLRRTVENLAEESYRKARSDLESDPEVAGAKTVLEQIVSLVTPFGMGEKVRADVEEKERRIAELSQKLADRELEVQKHVREKQETETLAKKAGYTLHLERRVLDHPSKETIIRLIGDVTAYPSIQEMDGKIDALLKEFKHVRPASDEAAEQHDELAQQIEGLKGQLSDVEAKLAEAHKRRDEAIEKARSAVKLAEEYQVQLHLERKLSDRPEAERQRIRTLAEDMVLGSKEDVDRFVGRVEFTPSADLGDDTARRIRERAQRGKGSTLVETRDGPGAGAKTNGAHQGSGLLEQFGLDDDQFDKLSGSPRS